MNARGLLNCWCNITIYRAIRELSDRRGEEGGGGRGTRVYARTHVRVDSAAFHAARCVSHATRGVASSAGSSLLRHFFPFPPPVLFFPRTIICALAFYNRRDLRYTALNARSRGRDAINWNRVLHEGRGQICGSTALSRVFYLVRVRDKDDRALRRYRWLIRLKY